MTLTRRNLLSSVGALALVSGLPVVSFAQARPDIVIATNELARGLEPGSDTGNVDVRVIYSIFDTLILRDFVNPQAGGGEKLVPHLAQSWKRVDPRTLEVVLRRGVKIGRAHVWTPVTL